MHEYYTFDEKPIVVSKNTGFQLLEDRGHRYIDMRDPAHGDMRTHVYSYLTNQIEEEMVDDFGHRYPVAFLVDYIEALSEMDHPQRRALVLILKEEQGRRAASYRQREAKGVVEMSDIETVFPAGTEVIAKTYDEGMIGGIVKSVKLQRSFWSGTYWLFTLSVVHAVKGEVQQGMYQYQMPGFRGLVPLSELPVRPVTAKERKTLTERGKRFAKFLTPGTYASYKGTLTQPGYWSSRTFRADGRVVISPPAPSARAYASASHAKRIGFCGSTNAATRL